MTGVEEAGAAMYVAYAAVAVAAVGAGVSAYSAVQQGNAAAAAANYNSKLAAQNAAIAQQQAQSQATQQQQRARATIGSEEAAYGASGVSTSGSPLDVLASSAQQSEFGRQTIMYQGALKSLGYNDQTQLDNAAAGNAQQQGDLKAGSAVLTGASSAIGRFGGAGSAVSTQSGSPTTTQLNAMFPSGGGGMGANS